MQGVALIGAGHGAEFNTSLGFVSAQPKLTTPLQSPGPPAPHPRVGRGIPRGPGRPSARGRGCAAATAGPDTTREWRFLRGWLGHLGPQPSPHPVAFGSDLSKQTAGGPSAPCPPPQNASVLPSPPAAAAAPELLKIRLGVWARGSFRNVFPASLCNPIPHRGQILQFWDSGRNWSAPSGAKLYVKVWGYTLFCFVHI